MTQDEINQSEWNNPKNWSNMVYRSQSDRRFLVPKRTGLGVTINFGNQKHGKVSLIALLAIILAGLVGTVVAVCLLLKLGWKK